MTIAETLCEFTHKGYPTTDGCFGSTFDACQGVQLNPGDFGTIVVE